MRILTAEAMQEVDRMAIEEIGIPSLVLMENAAIAVADAIGERYPTADSATIFCGPGNNGGDGLAVGRHLSARGYRVAIVVLEGSKGLSPDSETQLSICRRLKLDIDELELGDADASLVELEQPVDLIVDALFGTGLKRALSGPVVSLIEAINESSCPTVAVDLPSGLSGSSAETLGSHVEADLTVTFGAPKIAHVFPPAARSMGEVVVADLGFPPQLIDKAKGDLSLLTAEELAHSIPERQASAHKGDFGHLLVVAGSIGKSGAAVLAARAAVRTGAGLVTVAAPRSVIDLIDGGSVESMSWPLSVADDGGLGDQAKEEVLEVLAGKQAIAVGPGLGTAESTQAFVRQLVPALEVPLVLDADGLNAFAGRIEELAERSAATILTPHVGELARLLRVDNQQVKGNRLDAVRKAAAMSQSVVVLKGHLSLIADPQGGVQVNPTGNPGMATGGTGDVLTGVIAGLMAQSLEAPMAAHLGVFLHGLAGDLIAQQKGEIGLAAGDLVEGISGALEHLIGR